MALHRPVGSPVECTRNRRTDDVPLASAVAGRYAIKNGIVANRARAKRGLPAKTAPGTGATETASATAWMPRAKLPWRSISSAESRSASAA